MSWGLSILIIHFKRIFHSKLFILHLPQETAMASPLRGAQTLPQLPEWCLDMPGDFEAEPTNSSSLKFWYEQEINQ